MFLPLALSIAVGAGVAQPVSDTCLSSVEARQIVAAEKLIELEEATRLARQNRTGEVVSANLCRVNQRLLYVLAIFSPEGRVVRIAIDAKSRAVQDHR